MLLASNPNGQRFARPARARPDGVHSRLRGAYPRTRADDSSRSRRGRRRGKRASRSSSWEQWSLGKWASSRPQATMARTSKRLDQDQYLDATRKASCHTGSQGVHFSPSAQSSPWQPRATGCIADRLGCPADGGPRCAPRAGAGLRPLASSAFDGIVFIVDGRTRHRCRAWC